MKTNRYITITLGLLLLFGVQVGIFAQTGNVGEVGVTDQSVRREDGMLLIDFKVDLARLTVKSNSAVDIIPILTGKDGRALRLPKLLVTGRTRHIMFQRLPRQHTDSLREVRRYNNTAQQAYYALSIPYEPWMERSSLSLVLDLCGCNWEVVQRDRLPVATIDFSDPVFNPRVSYIAPAYEAVKQRKQEGSAFLDFPVNQTVIRPDYRNNPRELARIRATIDSVRNNRFATITAVSIKGHASPEGTYNANARLAQGRAVSLLNYVRRLYNFEGADFSVSSEPEDWEGLRRLVVASHMLEKEQVLAIIDGVDIFDGREKMLMDLSGGTVYNFMLREWFPLLRHSDYTVKYTVRNFTVEEAREMLYTDPRQLSLDEMYRVAQTYERGSDSFIQVFEIAVRIYPDDPVSNLNAANTALLRRDAAAARRYLQKAASGPEKMLAEQTLTELEEYLKIIERNKQYK